MNKPQFSIYRPILRTLQVMVLLGFVFGLSEATPAVVHAAGVTWYITSDGTDNGGCGGSPGTPCATFEYVRDFRALDSNDEIVLASGDILTQNFVITTGFDGLLIRTNVSQVGATNATINGYVRFESLSNGNVFENVDISGAGLGVSPDSDTHRACLRNSGGQGTPNVFTLGRIYGCNHNSAPGGGGVYNGEGVLTLMQVVIENNRAQNGGGIYNEGTLRILDTNGIENSYIRYNEAIDEGGGIATGGNGVTYLQYVNISENEAGANGGGIAHQSVHMTIVNSSISYNRAERFGGGVYITVNTVEIYRSLIAENVAQKTPPSALDSYGGGIYISGNSEVYLTSSTVSSNRADNNGGGIYLNNPQSVLTLTFSTVAFNASSQTVVGGTGGGIEVAQGSVELYNSLLGGNTSGLDGHNTCTGTINLNGNNVIETNDSGCNEANAQASDIIGTAEFNIGGLQNNGAVNNSGDFLLTHRLLEGSVAINNGSCSNIPAALLTNSGVFPSPDYEIDGRNAIVFDQRGQERGYNPNPASPGYEADQCDSGAFETFVPVIRWEWPDVPDEGDPNPVQPSSTFIGADPPASFWLTETTRELGTGAPPIDKRKLLWARIMGGYLPVEQIVLAVEGQMELGSVAPNCALVPDFVLEPHETGGFVFNAGSETSLPLRVWAQEDQIGETDEYFAVTLIDNPDSPYVVDTEEVSYRFKIIDSGIYPIPSESLMLQLDGGFNPTGLTVNSAGFGTILEGDLAPNNKLIHIEFPLISGLPVHPQTKVWVRLAVGTFDPVLNTATVATQQNPLVPFDADYYFTDIGNSTNNLVVVPVTPTNSGWIELTGTANCVPYIRVPLRIVGDSTPEPSERLRFYLTGVRMDLIENGYGATNDPDATATGVKEVLFGATDKVGSFLIFDDDRKIYMPILRREP